MSKLMNKTLALTAAAMALALSQGAYAQDAASAPKTRADVKADAAAANKAGSAPKGEESVKGQATGTSK